MRHHTTLGTPETSPLRRRRPLRTTFAVGAAVVAPVAVFGVAGAVGQPDLVPEAVTADPAPGGGTVALAPPAAAPASPVEPDAAAFEAYHAAGYQYCDAVAIAESLGTDDREAKLAVGTSLLAGAAVAPPLGCEDESLGVPAALIRFGDAGYGYCDAEQLAAVFGTGDPYETKLAVGEALLAGDAVPAPAGCAD